MSGTTPGLVTLTPEEAAALPGPPVLLPQVPTPDPAAQQEPPAAGQVIEITEASAEPAATPAAPAPAPVQPGAAPEPAPEPRTRILRGPRGTAAGVPDPIEEVGGLIDLLRRGARVRPETMPAPRAQDFVELGRRQIAVRAATTDEMEQVAQILGNQTPEQIRLITFRGGYMPTDVQEYISAIRLANENLFTEMRRGVQTREQQIAAAERIGFDGAVQMLLRRQPGEAFNNEGLLAAGLAVVNATRETRAAEAAMRAARPGSPEEAEAMVRFGLNHALTAAIAAQASGAASESARATGALRFIADAINSVPAAATGQVGPEALRIPAGASPQSIIEALGGVEVLRTQAAIWATLPDDAARTRMAQRTVGARVVDAIIAAYINSLLWLPSTHMRNILGTTSMGLWQMPETAVAAAVAPARIGLGRAGQAVGADRLPIVGNMVTNWAQDDRVVMGEALAQMYGIWAGFGEGLTAAGEAFRTNRAVGGFSRLELDRPNAISAEALGLSGTMGQAVDLLGIGLTLPGRALVTADSFFQAIGTRMALLQQAARQHAALIRAGRSPDEAAREVEALLANPPQMWQDAAETFARSMTFQDEMTGALGTLAEVMRHPIAKLFVPFFNTPTNIARAVINRSPVALAIPGQAWADIRAGGARADLAIARIALGSMVMWWFSGVVMNSASDPDFRVTGSAPGNPARREAFERQGFQPFSFCSRDGDRWTCRSFAGFDPLSGLMAMAADTANYTLDHPDGGDGPGLDEIAMGAAFGLYNFMLEQPFLTGVSDLARILGDTRQDGPERFRRAVEMFSQLATDAVISPLTLGTLAGGVERAVDPTLRSNLPTDPSVAQEGPVTRGFYAALRRAENRIPGLSEQNEPRLNLWGEEVRPTEGGLWELFWPIRTRSGRTDALEETLMRLGGVLAMPDRKFPGTNVELTAQQYNALIRSMNSGDDTGMTMREELLDLVQAPDFMALDPAEQMESIRRIRSRRWRAAQNAVLDLDIDLNQRVTRDREIRAVTGRSPRADMPALQ